LLPDGGVYLNSGLNGWVTSAERVEAVWSNGFKASQLLHIQLHRLRFATNSKPQHLTHWGWPY
jgi:hypothetical protein